MAENSDIPTSGKSAKKPASSAKGKTSKANGPAKAAPRKSGATARASDAPRSPTGAHAAEAKSRFNAALEEAKAGAAALRAEAGSRAGAYREQAKDRSNDIVNDARAYGDKALTRAGELAAEGKNAASDLIASLGKVVGERAEDIDQRLGAQYGDYARQASRSLTETSAKLEAKSVDELGDDAREFVRKSPGVAVGLAAVMGFFLARLFSGGKRG